MIAITTSSSISVKRAAVWASSSWDLRTFQDGEWMERFASYFLISRGGSSIGASATVTFQDEVSGTSYALGITLGPAT